MLLVIALLPVAAVASVSLASTAQAAAVSPTIDQAGGFPAWYQDNAGNRVVPCIDGNDANCGLAAPFTWDPNAPLTVPANYPSEFFYASATSDNLTTPGCAGTAPGKAFVTLALEGAFLHGAPTAGEQMAFGRIRVRVSSGLCPNTTYQFKEPFGTESFTTDDAGAIPPNAGTRDVGCTPAPPVVGCDFTKADGSPVMGSAADGGFLRWDPAVGPAAPAGYLGDGVTLHPIAGGTNGNDFSILDAGGNAVPGAGGSDLTTSQFIVIGKLAGSLSASPSAVDFGGQAAGTTSAAQTVTITNLAQGNVVPGAATIGGTDASDFAVTGSTCTGTALARDVSCSVDVTFTPSATGKRTATLDVPSTGGATSPLSVPLTGTGITASDAAAISVDPASLDFGSVRILTSSPVQNVVVANTGTAPLKVNSDTLSGDADQYRITSDTCTLGAYIDAGQSCTVSLAMAPSTRGAHAATLSIDSNGSATPQTVTLNGTAIGGFASVSPTNDPRDGFPYWYRDDNGIKVQQCTDPTNPYCIIVGDQFFDAAKPMVFPTNWPSEFFYHDAESEKLTTPGCNGTLPGTVMFRSAVEGTFINNIPIDQQQMVFGRVRIQERGGLCPNTTYTFVHPFGTVKLTTDGNGTIKVKDGTNDVGCAPLVPDTCDFTMALSSPNLGGLLRWDPNVGPAAPAGYLGDAVSLHPITGSTFMFKGPGDAAAAPVNYFEVLDPNNQVVVKTKLFTVMGKLQGPLEADPASVDADVTPVDSTSTPPPVTLTNTGITPLTINSLDVAGADASDFAIDSENCTGVTLNANDSCTLTVNFTPSATGNRSAGIVVHHTGLNDPFTLPLRGVGSAAQPTAAVSFQPRSLAFLPLHVTGTSNVEPITVSNAGGHAPLQVSSATLSGADSANFAIVGDTCTGQSVPVGGTCTVSLQFVPLSAGPKSVQLVINDNTAAGQHALTVTGSGNDGQPAVSPTTGAPGGYPDWYQDANGVQLAPCLDGSDPNCLVVPDPNYDPTQPTVFPTNFPTEFFYGNADSAVMITPGCGGTAPGKAMVRVALEGSFANGAVVQGDQTTFARLRIFVSSGLCPNVPYTFRTPYGDIPFQTDNNGALLRNQGTVDIGCNPVAPALCAFNEALTGPNPATGMNQSYAFSFLRPDPVGGTTAPAGYIGDGKTLGKVTGGTFVAPGTSEPVNYASIIDTADNTVLTTDRFLVSGKLAGPLQADAASVDFGQQLPNQASAASTVTFTALKAGTTITGLNVTGANAGAFAVNAAASTCAVNTALAAGAQCTVALNFTPATVGVNTAALQITTNNGGAVSVKLNGSGYALASAVSPKKLDFGSVDSGKQKAMPLTIENKGTAATTLTAQIDNPDFTVDPATSCPQLAAKTNCVLSVVFAPSTTTTTDETATLTINAAGETTTVPLTGTSNVPVVVTPPPTPGGTPEASLSRSTLGFGGVKLSGSKTLALTVKNTGTDTLKITGTPISGVGSADYTLVDTCTSVDMGKSCTVIVRFTPSDAGSRPATLTLSYKTIAASTVPLTGSGVASTFSVSRRSIAFGSHRHGVKTERSVTIKNTGPVAFRIGTVRIAGTDRRMFTAAAGCVNRFLGIGKACTFHVWFTPAAKRAYRADLVIGGDASTRPQTLTVKMAGTGR
jgi:hypothetical protein